VAASTAAIPARAVTSGTTKHADNISAATHAATDERSFERFRAAHAHVATDTTSRATAIPECGGSSARATITKAPATINGTDPALARDAAPHTPTRSSAPPLRTTAIRTSHRVVLSKGRAYLQLSVSSVCSDTAAIQAASDANSAPQIEPRRSSLEVIAPNAIVDVTQNNNMGTTHWLVAATIKAEAATPPVAAWNQPSAR
jgi:hypothetical protein